MMRPNPADWLPFATPPAGAALAAPARVLYDYASLHARVERLAGGLAARGVTAGAAGGAGAESQRHLCLTLACARLAPCCYR